jgi:hypothetical protein
VEKCEKVWRLDGGTADRHELPRAVYSIHGADATMTMEIRACSACAGDYEDPDRTAWTPDDAEDEDDGDASRATKEEFPAER